jgi:hypothetical protein
LFSAVLKSSSSPKQTLIASGLASAAFMSNAASVRSASWMERFARPALGRSKAMNKQTIIRAIAHEMAIDYVKKHRYLTMKQDSWKAFKDEAECAWKALRSLRFIEDHREDDPSTQ